MGTLDGLWTDMNEPTNACNGACASTSAANVTHPPYTVHNLFLGLPLDYATLAMDVQYSPGVVEYNAHNLYPTTEAQVTSAALESIRKERSFVLSRSTWMGTGTKAATWLGDNISLFASMALSIPGVLELSMSGNPFSGADICGYSGQATAELCARWTSPGLILRFSLRILFELTKPAQEN